MFSSPRIHQAIVTAALTGLVLACAVIPCVNAQQARQPQPNMPPQLSHPEINAVPLPIDRGQNDLARVLKELGTTASAMVIVAHPDDEDGAMMTYLSRGLGVRVSSLTLTRGEGGQNAMSSDTEEALGIIRTNELLKADEYYAAKQLWGTEFDFGFSKTQEESFQQWSHDRVLYDAVLAVREERPEVILATFLGGVSDGHGQHQVSGEIAQEVFKAAGDPKVFPEQLKNGLQPWQPLAMYSRVPFARIGSQGIFDYATGKWAPTRFHNYITGEWTTEPPSEDVSLPVGTWDSVLGYTYVQIAREGWGEQKSQNGGANPVLSGPATSSYHLWGVAHLAAPPTGAKAEDDDFFHNSKAQIDTSLAGLARLAGDHPPSWLADGLKQIDTGPAVLESEWSRQDRIGLAHRLARLYGMTHDLYLQVEKSNLDPQARASLLFELNVKDEEFQCALQDLLGLDLMAFTTRSGGQGGGPFAGNSADEMPRSVYPGETFHVRVHAAQATSETQIASVWLTNQSGTRWKIEGADHSPDDSSVSSAPVLDRTFSVQVPEDATVTEPYFTRSSPAQPYYDISNPEWRLRSFAPWPLAAWAEFRFDGQSIRVGKVVQTLERVTGPGGIYEPLLVTPALGLRMETEARILPLSAPSLDRPALPVKVTVHAVAGAQGTVTLNLPEGWTAQPAEAQFKLKAGSDSAPLVFSVTPAKVANDVYSVQAVAHAGGLDYKTGWQSIGYAGLRPYNQYKPASLKTRKVDVKLAPGLKVGYIMGPGDPVPEAIEELGVTPHILSEVELTSGNYSAWNVLMIGIRAYSTRPDLAAAQPHLDEFVRHGGTLIVQYQSETFPAPLRLAMGRFPERVVDEDSQVKLLDPSNALLTWPNKITEADFSGWVEERGHSFLDSWDPGYIALTETADPGQDPQRGGLLVAHQGNGTYIYVAYALYRQLPELVPGAYRLLANMLSAGRSPQEKDRSNSEN